MTMGSMPVSLHHPQGTMTKRNLPTGTDQGLAQVIDFQAARLRRSAEGQSGVRRESGAMRRARAWLAVALRAFQAERLAGERGYDPWARCPFWRVRGPSPDDVEKAGALVILVDALESYLVWEVTAAGGWKSGEFSTHPLEARAVMVPAGWVTLRAVAPSGQMTEREVEVEVRTVVALRVEPGRGVFAGEVVRWGT
jgi:hypothetical protein